jgi:predicted CopG family antitoxin
LAFRAPRRITITIPNGVYEELITRSNQEGRSLSNLAAFLIEKTLDDGHRP